MRARGAGMSIAGDGTDSTGTSGDEVMSASEATTGIDTASASAAKRNIRDGPESFIIDNRLSDYHKT